LAGIGIALAIVWGLLYFFIAPILGLVWTLLNLPANVLDPTKYGLIVVAYIGSHSLWFQKTGTCSGANILRWASSRNFFTSRRRRAFSASASITSLRTIPA
jgi:hypothetical protein